MHDSKGERVAPRTLLDYLNDAKETFRVCRWVWNELSSGESRYWVKRMLIALIIATALQLAQERLLSEVFNGIFEKRGALILLGLGGFFFGVALEKIAEHYQAVAREYLLGMDWGRLDDRITELFFEKSMGQHIQESSSLSIGNIDKARGKVLNLHGMLLFEGIPAMIALSLSYIFLWFLSPVAGGIMTVVILVYLVWMLFLNQRVVEVCIPIDREFRKLNSHRVERWDNIERVKTSGKEREELAHMTSWFNRAIREDRAFWLWFTKQCTIRGMANALGLIAIISYGAWRVWEGELAIGLLYPLFSWSMRVSENIWQIGHIEHQLNWNMPSIKSMMEALSLPPDIVIRESAVRLADGERIGVVFDDVSHLYPPGALEKGALHSRTPHPVLSHVSFAIKPGEKVALIGPSGVGKTTIMRLILRYMDPTSGVICVNGKDLRDIHPTSWMQRTGYIPQQAQVLDGTIRYNLTYGLSTDERNSVTDEELWRLMRLLKIDFGDRLTHGLDTIVGRNGVKLSGGQAQRLMIGAAALKRPRFMVIDEATSSLDSTTEKAVQRGLSEILKGEVSALVVAHRLSTVRYLCGKFIVLRDASEVRNGEPQIEAAAASFDELYDRSPTFRKLSDDQGVTIGR